MMNTSLFNKYIKNKRLKLGLTQTKVAHLAGVAISTICHIESGDYTRFPLNKVQLLAKILGEDKNEFSERWMEAVLENQKEKLRKKIYTSESG